MDKRKGIIIALIVVCVLVILGVVLFFGLRKDNKTSEVDNEESIIKQMKTLDDVYDFFDEKERDPEVKELSEEAAKEYIHDKSDYDGVGCDYGYNAYSYKDLVIVIRTEGCIGETEIEMYRGKDLINKWEKIYAMVLQGEDSSAADCYPVFKEGKLFFMQATGNTINFEYIDLSGDLIPVNVNTTNFTHGEE